MIADHGPTDRTTPQDKYEMLPRTEDNREQPITVIEDSASCQQSVAEIRKRSLDSPITPVEVFACHSNDEHFDSIVGVRSSESTLVGTSVLLSDQFPMPWSKACLALRSSIGLIVIRKGLLCPISLIAWDRESIRRSRECEPANVTGMIAPCIAFTGRGASRSTTMPLRARSSPSLWVPKLPVCRIGCRR